MFATSILRILDEMKEEDHTLLDKIIRYLYEEKKISPKTISILLGLSETIVYTRIPKETKKAKAKVIREKILKLRSDGLCPKEIAFDLKISISRVYKILRKEGL